ncbi:MAG: serine hydrolase domain-containing protein [Bacteroidota bacterium]
MKLILALCSCLVLAGNTLIQAQSLSFDQLEAKIDGMIADDIDESAPGLMVGVVHEGEWVFEKGYGLANLAYGIPNGPNMVYNIGSVSKQFLGFAFATLQVQGRVNLDAPVNDFLEDWSEFEEEVHLRHLLTHTSGYREAYTLSNLAGREIGVDRLSREECLEVVRRQVKLEFSPGSRYTYNSTAWVILAEVFEQITDTTAEEWVEINLLKPFGMNWTQIESYVGEVIQNPAESYTEQRGGGYMNPKSNRAIFGAAEVYANVGDLAKWFHHTQRPGIASKAVQDQFLNSFQLTDGTDAEYALGIGVGSHRGLKRYRHTGGHEAFVTQLSYYPDHDLGIIVISNFGGRASIPSEQIAELVLGAYMTEEADIESQRIELPEEALTAFAGLYVGIPLNQAFELNMQEGSLAFEGGTKLVPIGQQEFGIQDWDGKMVFSQSSNGDMLLSLYDDQIQKLKRVPSWEPQGEELNAYVGNYWSEELETLYKAKVAAGQLQLHHRWLGEINLNPITKHVFRSDWGFLVQFIQGADGEITGLEVNSGRTLGVWFERQ